MERLMERKLAVLEAEYNECINAENRARQTAADEAAIHGYGRVGAGGGGDEEEEEEEFSPAWTQFKADMEEERRQQQVAGSESDDGRDGAVAEESKQAAEEAELRVHAPLTSDKISSIKSVMSGIKLRPPAWAIGMSEEVWMARILERAGFVRRAVAANRQQQPSGQQTTEVSEEERKRRKEKKKARKAKKALEAKQQQPDSAPTTTTTSTAATTATTTSAAAAAATDSAATQQHQEGSEVGEPIAAVSFKEEDFEATFPAVPSPRPSIPPATTSQTA